MALCLAHKLQVILDEQIKDTCYLELARQTKEGDATLCENIGSSFKDKCYIDAAVKSNDAILCEKITSDEIKPVCFAIIANDTRFCDNITNDPIRNECYRLCNSTIEKGNETATPVAKESDIINSDELAECEKITEVSAREKCYVQIAETNNDSSICEKIEDDNIKDICYSVAQK